MLRVKWWKRTNSRVLLDVRRDNSVGHLVSREGCNEDSKGEDRNREVLKDERWESFRDSSGAGSWTKLMLVGSLLGFGEAVRAKYL